jgi:predicted DNA-binding transcriptional regulator AlpA
MLRPEDTKREDTKREDVKREDVKREEAKRAALARELWRFRELKLLGYVADRATARRRMDKEGFPQPIVLSGNAIAWVASEVIAWVASRPRGSAPQPHRAKAEAGSRSAVAYK